MNKTLMNNNNNNNWINKTKIKNNYDLIILNLLSYESYTLFIYLFSKIIGF